MAGSTAKPLEARLLAVAGEIRAETYADIGADHALLPRYLLQTGRVRRVIVVEKSRGPWENARRALRGLPAEVRLGDGLGPLAPGEVEALSLCGMGARRMVRILSAHPERLPSRIVLQPNDAAEPLRRWGLEAGFALSNEQMVPGFWCYTVLTFVRGPLSPTAAYQGLPREVALRYGPLLLAQRHPLLRVELERRRAYLKELPPVERVRLEQAYLEQAVALWDT